MTKKVIAKKVRFTSVKLSAPSYNTDKKCFKSAPGQSIFSAVEEVVEVVNFVVDAEVLVAAEVIYESPGSLAI